jgi:hypothetical protein
LADYQLLKEALKEIKQRAILLGIRIGGVYVNVARKKKYQLLLCYTLALFRAGVMARNKDKRLIFKI